LTPFSILVPLCRITSPPAQQLNTQNSPSITAVEIGQSWNKLLPGVTLWILSRYSGRPGLVTLVTETVNGSEVVSRPKAGGAARANTARTARLCVTIGSFLMSQGVRGTRVSQVQTLLQYQFSACQPRWPVPGNGAGAASWSPRQAWILA
jgi:hypothetical protein